MTPYSDISGSSISLLNLVKQLNQEVITPIVVLPENGFLVNALLEIGIMVRVVPMKRLDKNLIHIFILFFSLPRTLFMLFKIQKENIDIIYCNTLINFYGGLLSVLSGKPCIYHIHEARETYPNLLFKLLAEHVKWTSRKIILVSKFTAIPFQNIQQKCIIVYNGVDYSEYSPLEKINRSITNFQIKEDTLYVTLVGSIGRNKGQHILIESLNILKDRFENLQCFLVGKVTKKKSTQRYFQLLYEKIESFNLESRIHYLGIQENIKEVLTSSDILVLPSYSENHPLILLEAMAAGLPVIASNVGGIPEIIKDGENGLLFPCGDAHSLAEQISNLLTDSKLKNRIIENAKITVQKQFSLNKMVSKIESLILNV